MTYEEIFDKTKNALSSADVSGVKEHIAVEVDIIGEGAGAFYIEIKDGKCDIQPYEYYDRDCRLIATGEDFLKIVDGSLDAVKAFGMGKLKVEGSIDKALEFSKIVKSAKASKPAKTEKAASSKGTKKGAAGSKKK